MANTPQSYTSKFRTLTPAKLAEIIVREEDYHPDAVTAARLELTARMLPAEELDRLYDLAEQQKAKSSSDGSRLGIGSNPKVEAVRDALKDKTKSSIWARTGILKLIFGYLVFSISISIYNLITSLLNISSYGGVDSYLSLGSKLIDPLILVGLIGLGLKWHKVAWWGTLLLFTLMSVFGILANYSIYQYYYAYDDATSGLSGIFLLIADDLMSAGFTLLFPVTFLYLTLRKDTRIACGISKVDAKKMDDLDHLI